MRFFAETGLYKADNSATYYSAKDGRKVNKAREALILGNGYLMAIWWPWMQGPVPPPPPSKQAPGAQAFGAPDIEHGLGDVMYNWDDDCPDPLCPDANDTPPGNGFTQATVEAALASACRRIRAVNDFLSKASNEIPTTSPQLAAIAAHRDELADIVDSMATTCDYTAVFFECRNEAGGWTLANQPALWTRIYLNLRAGPAQGMCDPAFTREHLRWTLIHELSHVLLHANLPPHDPTRWPGENVADHPDFAGGSSDDPAERTSSDINVLYEQVLP